MQKSFIMFCALLCFMFVLAAKGFAAETSPAWPREITLGGTVAGEYRWMKHSDITDKNSDATSDLYLRTVELSLEAAIADWINAGVTVNSEWIGDDVNQGDEKLTLDEAVISLRKEGLPVYLIVGKRTQPFGVFENYLVTDPMTQDAYETKRVGVTLGYNRPFMDLDASVTIYKGEEMMAHLFDSGLFDSDNISRVSDPAGDDTGSYILNITVTPLPEHLNLSASYLSEPGNGNRNDSLSIAADYSCLFMEGLTFNAEYIAALKREKYQDAASTVLSKSFREKVFSFSAAYNVMDTVDVALRYEHLDDDSLTGSTGAWSVKDRYSAGVGYSFYTDETSGVNAFLAAEYRRTEIRVDSASGMDDSNDEFYTRLGVNF